MFVQREEPAFVLVILQGWNAAVFEFARKRHITFLRKGMFLMREVLKHIKTAWHLLVAR